MLSYGSAGSVTRQKVRIFGYGGHLENETLNGDDLKKYDDVPEVATCTVGGRRLFYGRDP